MDHTDANFRASSLHISIFKRVQATGETELYRHFVKQPNGVILELFDWLESQGTDDMRRLEKELIKKKLTKVEKERLKYRQLALEQQKQQQQGQPS
jgi:hypothetical protein